MVFSNEDVWDPSDADISKPQPKPSVPVPAVRYNVRGYREGQVSPDFLVKGVPLEVAYRCMVAASESGSWICTSVAPVEKS